MSDVQATRRCWLCKAIKPVSDFYPRRRSKDGLQRTCKACNRKIAAAWNRAHPEKGKAWRSENRDKENEWRRQWAKSNPKKRHEYESRYANKYPGKVRAKCARRRALRVGAASGDAKDLTAFYELVRSAKKISCHWCGKPVTKHDRHVDHIIPLSRGGAHDVLNLCCSCSACNLKKHDKLPAEFTGQFEIQFT